MDVYIPVVGNYYTGNTPKIGEYVFLSVELDNPVDSDAICVVNTSGKKVGYIPKAQTRKYRQYMGVVGKIFKYKNGYRIKIHLP